MKKLFISQPMRGKTDEEIKAERAKGVPIGTTQTTTTAMVYSQTWTNANGSGELYLTKLDKKILGVGNRIGYFNPYSDLMQEEEAND